MDSGFIEIKGDRGGGREKKRKQRGEEGRGGEVEEGECEGGVGGRGGEGEMVGSQMGEV